MAASTRKKKMKTTKITTMKIMANCNQEKGGGNHDQDHDQNDCKH